MNRLSRQLILSFHGRRYLSLNETSTALRPFFFAVHPDLFGRFPKEQSVNENSLKQLSQHLEHLHSQPRHVSSLDLVFYVRDVSSIDTDLLKTVRIKLASSCIRETVTTVLRSFDLSLDYVDSVASSAAQKQPDRPITWSRSFAEAFNDHMPKGHSGRKKPDTTLDSWLFKNISKAKARRAALAPIRSEIKQLTGCSLILGTQTGVCIHGNISLNCDDVPESWVSFFRALLQHDALRLRIPSAENYVSSLLRNITIVKPGSSEVTTTPDYLFQLRVLASAVREYPDTRRILTQNLSDVQAVVECTPGTLTVDPKGRIHIPASCPAFLVIDFLKRNAENARLLSSNPR
ncbi:hypothetical protein CAPTEDRAFT_196223 [Capitella teleta]|uniref:DUF4460 domain-containing protein n=1 Tax=Capitella teleta TaxID=283909 RepID=R7U774_CAPTE|nr:hypothetical protein CAPTEDRAFT_196223 [Capitella teleta]|eukprot:ELT99526.1 hypothetical protein CAPTEDRAFT_196223 [Capitella teleta]